MLRFLVAVAAVCLFAGQSSAQWFPNAPWNKGTRFSQSEDCPGGVCPNGAGIRRMAAADPSLIEEHNTAHNGYPGGPQWTWPGDLATHLRNEHRRAPASSYSDPVNYVVASPSGSSTGSVRSYGSTGSRAVSYGSSGSSLRVGCPDVDGAIVSSIGSTVDPRIAKAATVEMLSIGDRRDFRKALLDAGRKARDAGEITSMEFFALSAASRSPRVLEKMQAAVHEAAIEEGLATAQAVDWDSLIEFIEKLIPIIIKLIDLFS